MSDKKRISLYERLPEIYRIKDREVNKKQPPLKNYLSLVEKVFGDIHENIETLYSDLFIDSCDSWVVPYIGDLLGTSHLKGDPWTIRADVADTIALRRRKGTLAGIERLTYNLTKWGVHCVELRENLVWSQHLNHQRPDSGGEPPYGLNSITRNMSVRGGTVALRDPGMLSFMDSPFDPFSHFADLKPHQFGNINYNLPNLAIFLWRLRDNRIHISRPAGKKMIPIDRLDPNGPQVVNFYVHPLGAPLRLFNTYRFDSDREPPIVTHLDETPGPIPMARLSEGAEAGNPEAYFKIETYSPANTALNAVDIGDVGLQLHLPEPEFSGKVWPKKNATPVNWFVRGANLCAWQDGVRPPIKVKDIVIDPVIGRIAIGVLTKTEATALMEKLLITFTYGAPGPVGAHPTNLQPPLPKGWGDETIYIKKKVEYHINPDGLSNALSGIQNSSEPILIEIKDSMVYELDLGDTMIRGIITEDGGPNLRLAKPLVIRAAQGERPIIRLKSPLRFRPTHVVGATPAEQKKIDANISSLFVSLEGLYITWDKTAFPTGEALIARAALGALNISNCTLDPGGGRNLDGTASGSRTPIRSSLMLKKKYGFINGSAEEEKFKETPKIDIKRSISGPILIDEEYKLSLSDSIIDAGKGVGAAVDPAKDYALSNATDKQKGYGPPSEVRGVTFFGKTRVFEINGTGGIWVHSLEVLNNQVGCVRESYFSGMGDRLVQNTGCVKGIDGHDSAELRFTSEIFGEPGYAQLKHSSDFRIRERGPKDDQMGAYGFMMDAHKWRNIQIRYREFMPVGVRPLIIPTT